MNCHLLSIEERSCIRKYYVDGLSCREIARLIGRNAGTAPREIRRIVPACTNPGLLPAHSAQEVPAAPLLLSPGNIPFAGSD